MGAGQGRADRRSQSLAEADAHRVEVLRPFGGRRAGGDDRIEQPRAVQMGSQPVSMGPGADFSHAFQRLNAARPAIVRDFQ